jgi:6-phosphofructokinase 1
MGSVEQTRAVNAALKAGEYDTAMDLRGGSFRESFDVLRTLTRVIPKPAETPTKPLTIGILHAGAPAPGMNAAVRVAVRQALDQGHRAIGIRQGFQGLIEHDVEPLEWMSVSGWTSRGGADLGVTRRDLSGKDLYAIARTIEAEEIGALLVIGGWSGYKATHRMFEARDTFPAFNIPIVCMPATIDNNLPGSEVSIGADTALNSIVTAVDKIKQSATAAGRCFVVEVMGRYCGYLALMSGLAPGAERVFLHEEGITLRSLEEELDRMKGEFERGKRLELVIRNENANEVYSTGFMRSLFEEEGGELFSVRQAILGHQQQGGDPSPYDRILATRLATHCIRRLVEQAAEPVPEASFIGIEAGAIRFTHFQDFPRLVDEAHQRPRDQWWMGLRTIAAALAHAAPQAASDTEE